MVEETTLLAIRKANAQRQLPVNIQTCSFTPDMTLSQRLELLRNEYYVDSLPELAMLHYQKYDRNHWDTFLSEWVPKCNVAVLCYTNMAPMVCTGFALCISDDKSIYVRLLCSWCHCGGKLLKHVCQMAPSTRLHAEPGCVGFYKKYGFAILENDYECNVMGTRYPLMISGELQDGDVLCAGNFFYGWWYYLETYVFKLLFVLLAFVILWMQNNVFAISK